MTTKDKGTPQPPEGGKDEVMEQPIAVISIEYNMATGNHKMSAPANVTLAYGMLQVAVETIMKGRIKAELANEIIAADAKAPKIVKATQLPGAKPS